MRRKTLVLNTVSGDPEPQYIEVTSTGRLLAVDFSLELDSYTSGAGISLTGACFVSCSTSGTMLNIVVTGVLPGEAVTVSYDAGIGSLAGSSGGVVQSFGPTAAVNNSALSGAVAALLSFNGADGGTTFTDAAGGTWTPVGFVNTSTTIKKFGSASANFYGTGYTDALKASSHPATAYGSMTEMSDMTESFTIETWVRFSSVTGAVRYIFTTGANETGIPGISVYKSSSGGIVFTVRAATNDALAYASASTTSVYFGINTWHHLALVYEKPTYPSTISNMYIWIDGALVAASSRDTNGVTWTSSAAAPKISTYGEGGDGDDEAFAMSGYLDDFRFSVGVARYLETFVPPTYQLAMPV